MSARFRFQLLLSSWALPVAIFVSRYPFTTQWDIEVGVGPLWFSVITPEHSQ